MRNCAAKSKQPWPLRRVHDIEDRLGTGDYSASVALLQMLGTNR